MTVYNPLIHRDEEYITVKTLSQMTNMKPTLIRKKLRANKIQTKPVTIPEGWPPQYYWTKDDPELDTIIKLLSEK
jgi:hypothetical protein